MITDYSLQMSGSWAAGSWTPQSIVGSGTINSTNSIDTGPDAKNQPLDLGMGETLKVAVQIIASVAGATAVQFNLVSADDPALSVNVEVISASPAIPVAQLTAGQSIFMFIDRAAPNPPRRYVGMQYVLTGTSTAGSVLAEIVKDVQDVQNTIYKSGFTV